MNAFLTDPKKIWHSGPRVGKTPLPAYVWYDFVTRQIRPAKVSFRPRQDDLPGAKKQTPGYFQLVGTNEADCNEDSQWQVLCQDLSGIPVESLADRRSCQVRREDIRGQSFRCVGIRILQVDSWEGKISFGGVRLWGFRDE